MKIRTILSMVLLILSALLITTLQAARPGIASKSAILRIKDTHNSIGAYINIDLINGAASIIRVINRYAQHMLISGIDTPISIGPSRIGAVNPNSVVGMYPGTKSIESTLAGTIKDIIEDITAITGIIDMHRGSGWGFMIITIGMNILIIMFFITIIIITIMISVFTFQVLGILNMGIIMGIYVRAGILNRLRREWSYRLYW